MLGDQPEHERRVHLAQADVGTAHQRHGPRVAPAVAVEERQRPQVHRARRQVPGQDVADGHQERPAVVIDDALGITRRPRRVVERDRLALVARRAPFEVGRSLGQERFVLDLAERAAGAVVERVVDVDDEELPTELLERRADDGGELAVGDERLRLAVAEDVGDRARIEPGVDGVEDRSGHGHAIVGVEHRRDVGEHDGHGVAGADATRGERRRQPPCPRVEVAVRDAPVPVDHGHAVGVNGGRARKKGHGCQRREVRRPEAESARLERVHHGPSSRGAGIVRAGNSRYA